MSQKKHMHMYPPMNVYFVPLSAIENTVHVFVIIYVMACRSSIVLS